MSPRIISLPAFEIIGKSLRVSTNNNAQFERIPVFWGDCHKDGTVATLRQLSNKNLLGDTILGVCSDFADDMSEFTYTVGVEAPGLGTDTEYATLHVPAVSWAIFESKGALPESIQRVWKSIMGDFFPNSDDYTHAAAPEIEVYPYGDPRSDHFQCEVWVPVKPK